MNVLAYSAQDYNKIVKSCSGYEPSKKNAAADTKNLAQSVEISVTALSRYSRLKSRIKNQSQKKSLKYPITMARKKDF